jgi:hypothetical protein
MVLAPPHYRGYAGDRQDRPLRVLAPQRRASRKCCGSALCTPVHWCMGSRVILDRGENPAYAVVRTYERSAANELSDLLERRKAEIEAVMRTVPG